MNQIIKKPVMVFQAPSQAIETIEDKNKREDRKIIKLSFYVVGGLVAIWFILSFIVGFSVVNGISMQPTFHTNDIVLLWKLPKTWASLTGTQYIPSRSSVVIIKDTDNNGELFIKRIISLPGETVHVNNGIVSVNTLDGRTIFPDKAKYGSVIGYTPGYFVGTVGSGEIFVLGDNREPGASIDSRSSLGAIPASYIQGKVFIRVWPINRFKLF